MERPVYFQSNGKKLFGIFHHPENNSRKVGVIFLNSGLQYRVGPHRFYVKTARRLSQLGFSSLRMDFTGLGDSEGEVGDLHLDTYDIEDTLRAVDFLTQEEMIEKVVLLGVCSGARNAVKAASKDIRVDSIISLSLPIITESRDKLHIESMNMSRVAAKHYLKECIKKAFNIKVWKRYFSYDRNSPPLKNVFSGLMGISKKRIDDRHRDFLKAFESFLSSKRKALFMYGERDTILKEEFEVKFKELSDGKRHVCEYYIIPNGDHTFPSVETQRNVVEKTLEWLTQQYG